MRPKDSSSGTYSTLRSAAWLLLACLLLSRCDTFEPVAFTEEYVVEAFLGAGEELPSIRLSRTAEVDATYDFDALAVSDARVRVTLLTPDGLPSREYRYTESTFRPGIYLPFSPDTVLAGRTYVLSVVLPTGQDSLSAQTTVPEALFVTHTSADTLVYQGPEQLEVDLSTNATDVGDRVFVFTARALDPIEENLTPFARSIFEQGELTLADLSTSSSPLLNEANYEHVSGNTIRITLPWLAVSFYGPNRLSVASVDQNYYDFYRTLGVQQGGSTLSPGEIPDVIDHVEGGRGLFASYAQAIVDLYVKRPGEE